MFLLFILNCSSDDRSVDLVGLRVDQLIWDEKFLLGADGKNLQTEFVRSLTQINSSGMNMSEDKGRISTNISARLDECNRPFSNLNAWARCYKLFGDKSESDDHAALQLGFFLASWGMMRGSSFLKSCDYDVHLNAVKLLRSEELQSMRGREIKLADIPVILNAKIKVEDCYKCLSSVLVGKNVNVTETLSSKIMLATLGCVPAYDRYFRAGLKRAGIIQSFSIGSLSMIVDAVDKSCSLWKHAADRVSLAVGFEIPMMRVVDMHYFSEGKYED
jgi:hypothetical protein